MAEDLPATLGTHCAYSSCNELDFLPISCPHCSLIFCRHHASTAAHACTQDPHNRMVSDPSRFEQKFNDLLPDPNRLVGERAAVEQARNDKAEAARKVLEKNFGREAVAKLGDGAGVKRASSSTDSAAKRPSPKVVSPVIALMKLKQRAKPVDNKAKELAMDDRLYLTVELLEGEGQVKRGERELWISKNITAGRALDHFATVFTLSNVNNVSADSSKLLVLAAPGDPPTRIPTSEKLSASVGNGGSVLLLRGSGL